MAQLVVRNLDDELKHQLQLRAARSGRSMESEVREILRSAVEEQTPSTKGLGSEIADLFRGSGLDSEIQDLRGQIFRPVEFEP